MSVPKMSNDILGTLPGQYNVFIIFNRHIYYMAQIFLLVIFRLRAQRRFKSFFLCTKQTIIRFKSAITSSYSVCVFMVTTSTGTTDLTTVQDLPALFELFCLPPNLRNAVHISITTVRRYHIVTATFADGSTEQERITYYCDERRERVTCH